MCDIILYYAHVELTPKQNVETTTLKVNFKYPFK